MNTVRRTLVAALTLVVFKPLAALAAWNERAFGAKTAADAMKGLGLGDAAPSRELTIDAPQIAENGAVVPIEVSSSIPGTSAISVIIEKNPFPLVARFEFKEGALPFVKVNVKMGETSDIRAIAEAGGRSYSATREVKVTIGGCGG